MFSSASNRGLIDRAARAIAAREAVKRVNDSMELCPSAPDPEVGPNIGAMSEEKEDRVNVRQRFLGHLDILRSRPVRGRGR